MRAVWAVRAAGVGHGLVEGGGKCERWGRGGEGGGGSGGASARGGLGLDWEPVLEPLKHCFWAGWGRWGRCGRCGRRGLGRTGARKTGHGLEPVKHWGAAVGAVRAVWAVWTVRAVRAAGVGHGLEPVKWTGARKTLLFMAGRRGGGQVRAVGAVKMWAVWAVAGVTHFHGKGAGGGGGKCERWGGGLGMDWEPVLEPLKDFAFTLLFMAGALRWGR